MSNREALVKFGQEIANAVSALEAAERAEQNAAELKRTVDGLLRERSEKVEELAQIGRDIEAAAAHRAKVNAEFDAAFKARRAQAEQSLREEREKAEAAIKADLAKIEAQRDAAAAEGLRLSREVARLSALKDSLESKVAAIRKAVGDVKL